MNNIHVIYWKNDHYTKILCITDAKVTDNVLCYIARVFNEKRKELYAVSVPVINHRNCANIQCNTKTLNMESEFCYLHQPNKKGENQ